MPPIRGRPMDQDVVAGFRVIETGPLRMPVMECIYCRTKKARNTPRQREHLASCGPYLRAMEERNEVNSITLRQHSRLQIQALTPEATEVLNIKAAMAVYMGARPFTLYEEYYMDDFITTLNAAYKPLRRDQLSGPYLDKCYAVTKTSIESRLRTKGRLNFVTDESTNIRKERIINLCCNIPLEGAYYICSKAIGSVSMGGEEITAWVLQEIKTVTSDNFSRVNSVATDTCNTMRNAWGRLQEDRRLQHAFFIPCDR